MTTSKRQWLLPVGFLVLCGVLWTSVAALPEIVARLAYAAETGQSQAAKEQLARAADVSQAFQYVAKAMRPSVVSISSVRRVEPSVRRGRPVPEEFSRFFGDDLLDRFFEFQAPPGGFEQRGLGSGVIVSEDGYILTNNHVIRGATEINVTLSDNRTFPASLVGGDEKSDIAVLKVDAGSLTPARLGDSDTIEVGEWVLAIGSPFGLDQTVTAGIVSAKGRAEMGIADYEDFIQTDAAINPGNSGGPLVNLQGEVIGINTAIASRTGGYMGVGFAIPASMVRGVMTSIIEKGEVQRGFLGAGIQDLTDELARSFGYDSARGVLIADVVVDGPAHKAGLQSRDIVVEVDGKPVERASQLRNLIASTPPGTHVSLLVFRDGTRRTFDVEVGRLESQATVARGREQAMDLGMTVQTLTPEIAQQLGEDENLQGVVVTNVEPGGPASRVGIRRGDIILEVGAQEVRNAADFREAMAGQNLQQGVRIRVQREGARRFVFFREQ